MFPDRHSGSCAPKRFLSKPTGDICSGNTQRSGHNASYSRCVARRSGGGGSSRRCRAPCTFAAAFGCKESDFDPNAKSPGRPRRKRLLRNASPRRDFIVSGDATIGNAI
jgi:hypothetical protein